MSLAKKYDLVLYGATGFVGQQTVAYIQNFAQKFTQTTLQKSGPTQLQPQPHPLRWAIAGRNAAKLEAVRAQCGTGADIGARNASSANSANSASGPDVIVADAQDTQALNALAASARVVLSSAGPFALYGSALVAACVRERTHYVDITGETPWVRSLIDAHHAQAARDGTRIIPCCGFDSVPSDIGAYLLAQTMWERYKKPCVSVKAAFSMRGGLNGGTLASILNIMADGQSAAFSQPFLLNPAGTALKDPSAHQDITTPTHDTDFAAWVGPFVMAAINTRVVRRSAALLGAGSKKSPYGKDFYYQEYLRFGKGPLAATTAAGMSFGMGLGQSVMRFGIGRSITAALAPKPGEGPSERSMDSGRFRVQMVGASAAGDEVRLTLSDSGDPGNRATTKMVCESALALALNTADLPGGLDLGGVLTPASGLGDVLVQRLRAAGMQIEVQA